MAQAPLHGPVYPQAVTTLPEMPHHDPMTADGMTPEDTVMWLNTAMDLLDDHPPTQEQWNKIRAKITEQVGAIVHERMNRHLSMVQQSATFASPTPQQTVVWSRALMEEINRRGPMSQQLAMSAISAVNLGSVSDRVMISLVEPGEST